MSENQLDILALSVSTVASILSGISLIQSHLANKRSKKANELSSDSNAIAVKANDLSKESIEVAREAFKGTEVDRKVSFCPHLRIERFKSNAESIFDSLLVLRNTNHGVAIISGIVGNPRIQIFSSNDKELKFPHRLGYNQLLTIKLVFNSEDYFSKNKEAPNIFKPDQMHSYLRNCWFEVYFADTLGHYYTSHLAWSQGVFVGDPFDSQPTN